MLINTIKAHPLLKQLYISDEQAASNNLFGLSAKQLKISKSYDGECYCIGVDELIKIFKDRCAAADINAINKFLNFDYKALSAFPRHHPFYIESNPFTHNFLLQQITKANDFNQKNVSLRIQLHIKEWIDAQLESKSDSLFSSSVATTVHAVSVFQPNLAFRRLAETLSQQFVLTNSVYSNENYNLILQAIEGIAIYSEYFYAACRTLLGLAASEGEIGIYHGHYKALHSLTNLFRNAGANTMVSLEQRKEYLRMMVSQADTGQNYYQLYMLMKVFGIAANTFESGEHDYIEDPYFIKYLHFSIDVLMRYAGIDDEWGLHLTAEEELSKLLKSTIDEPEIWGASDVPFLILRHFLESKREFNINPFCHLDDLRNYIEFCKSQNDKDDFYIKKLELRLEQLISLVAHREFVSKDFVLCLSAKSPEKECQIDSGYQADSKLDLHGRQSLAERLVFSGKTNLHDIERQWPKCTYVVANFGMIISDIPHSDISRHKRVFESIAIENPEYTISGRVNECGGHAEEALYEYLLKDENIIYLLNRFKSKFGLSAEDHKVYGIILDLHGTYDMCLSCSKKGLDFQDAFRQKLLKIFPQQKLKTRKKFPNQLPIIIRYSSDLQYDYPHSNDDKKKSTLVLVSKEGEKRDLSIIAEEKEDNVKYRQKRNISNYGANLLIHGKNNWHSFWSKSKRDEFEGKPLKLESWTAFTTDYQINNIDERRKKAKYTRSGEVETNSKKQRRNSC